VIPCGHVHQSFTDTLEKWFFDNFPMFPIVLMFFLFIALPVDQVQAFCTIAHRAVHGSLRQYGLLVSFASNQNVQTFAVDDTLLDVNLKWYHTTICSYM